MFLSDKTDVSPECSTCLSMMVSLFNILPHRFLNYVCVLYTVHQSLYTSFTVRGVSHNSKLHRYVWIPVVNVEFSLTFISSKGIKSTRCNVIMYTLQANQEESKHLKVIKSNILPSAIFSSISWSSFPDQNCLPSLMMAREEF